MRSFAFSAFGATAVCLINIGAEGQCEVSKLRALDPREDATLGFDPSVSGDVLIAAAIDDGPTLDAAHVFRFDGTDWMPEAKLTASDGEPGDQFGVAAISGDVALVGAWTDDNTGSAYVFRFDPGSLTWSEKVKLVAPDAETGDDFGIKVAVRGDVALVGSPQGGTGGTGSVYAFRYNRLSHAWDFEQKLVPDEATPGDSVGYPVALSPCGTVAIIGAPFDGHAGPNSGATYVYRHDGTQWGQEQRLTASDAAAGDFFGIDAAIDREVAVVGAFAPSGTGAVYAFRYSLETGEWEQEPLPAPADLDAGDWFGWSVGVSADTIAALAVHDDDAAPDAGAVYLYRHTAGMWMQQAKLTASDAGASDWFGGGIAVDGDHLVVGAPHDDDGAMDAGAVYAFAGLLGVDYDGNGVSDACDALCPADTDGDGTIGFGDLLTILSGWGICP